MTTISRGDVTTSLINLVRKDARRRNRRKAFGKLVEALVQSVILTALHGFWLMMAVGVVHHEWIPACPTIGYGWAVLLAALLRSTLIYIPVKREADR